MSVRLKALLVVFLFAAACTPEQAAAPPPSARTSQQMAMLSDGVVPADRWRVVLIAGDNNSPAFDNASASAVFLPAAAFHEESACPGGQ